MGRSAEEVAARRPPSSPDSACKRRPRPHRQGEEGGAGAIQSGKGRVLLPNHMNFRKGGGGSFSIQTLPKAQQTRGLSSAYQSYLFLVISQGQTQI